MTELPHLAVHLRQLSAAPPPRASLRQLLSTLRMRYALKWIFWGTVALLGAVDLDQVLAGSQTLAYYSAAELLANALTLGGNLIVYLTFAAAANSLMAEPGRVAWPRLAIPDTPLWFASRLPSSNPLLATFLIALLSVLPVLVGLLTHLALQNSHLVSVYGPDQAASWHSFWWANLGAVVRLPQFYLACCCLSLALRRSICWAYVPLAMALAATLCAGFGFGRWDDNVTALTALPFGPGGDPRGLLLLAALALLLWVFGSVCRRMATAESTDGAGVAFLLLVGGMPFAASVLAGVNDVAGYAYVGALSTLASTSLHAFYATFLPDIQAFSFDGTIHRPFNLYGLPLSGFAGMILAAICYLLSLGFWWLTAKSCLDAARGLTDHRAA